jgi:hypothetical protein
MMATSGWLLEPDLDWLDTGGVIAALVKTKQWPQEPLGLEAGAQLWDDSRPSNGGVFHMISGRCARMQRIGFGFCWALSVGLAVSAQGCGAAAVPQPTARAVAASAEPVAPPPPPLAPLNEEETVAKAALQGEVAELAAIGPRNIDHTWNLATAADHLALKLEGYGYKVSRLGFMAGEEPLMNIEVEITGRGQGEELVVLATHYDTLGDSPGANTGATGAAALLVLAKSFAGQHFARSVRLVWLANESGGPSVRGSSGSAYLTALKEQARPVVATLTLGSLGYYTLQQGAQRYPEELLYGAEHRNKRGDFLALVANPASNALLERVHAALSGATLPIEDLILPDSAPLAAGGPQAFFWQAGLAGVLLTDTGEFRDPHRGAAGDTLDKLDFDRLARVFVALPPLVAALAGQ